MVQINVAGRQRMLSQQMPKALLMVERQVAEGNVGSVVLAELGQSVRVFEQTLHASLRDPHERAGLCHHDPQGSPDHGQGGRRAGGADRQASGQPDREDPDGQRCLPVARYD